MKKDEWRDRVATLHDKEDEYDWTDQYGQATNPPWKEGQQIGFKLKPWIKANAAARFAKNPPPPDGSSGPSGPERFWNSRYIGKDIPGTATPRVGTVLGLIADIKNVIWLCSITEQW